jgi:hypothetical protein
LFLYFQWANRNWQEHNETVLIVTGAILAALTGLGLAIGSPIAVITGLIALLGTAIIAVKENWATIYPKLIQIWEDIKTKAKEIWGDLVDWFNKYVVGPISRAADTMYEAFQRAKEALTKIPGVGGMIKGAKQLGGYIPETGLYMLHSGEYVVPRGRLAYAGVGVGGINITITGNTFMSDEDAAVKIGDMIIKVLKRNVKI